jgi:uncharacterized protein YjiS (DUF1127 family)
MREAAFEIARQSDAFAQTIARQFVDTIAEPVILIRNAWVLATLRAQLRRLQDHQLNDIGITRLDIDELGINGLGSRPAIETLMTERRLPAKTADILRFRRRADDCAWPCVRS